MNQSLNDEAVCRTALATPGLLISFNWQTAKKNRVSATTLIVTMSYISFYANNV